MTGTLFDGGISHTSREMPHQNARGSDVWLTPPALLAELGPFDLDPCAAPEPRPWPTAAVHYTASDDGLRREWQGRVWLNPPYSDMERWIARLADHDYGMALIFARTDTGWFHRQVWERATSALFIRRRVHFYLPDGRSGQGKATTPSVLVAYGPKDDAVLARRPVDGAYVRIRSDEAAA
jgi:phage N-6-adenine-methyltransferase